MRPLATTLLVFVLATIYLFGVMMAVRLGLMVEVFIAFIFPALCIACRLDTKFSDPRIRELFFIESIYNLMVVISKLSIQIDSPTLNTVGQWGFFVFMFVQLGGFLIQVTRAKSLHGMIQTIAGISVLFIWWWSIPDRTSIIDADGRFLMWGEDTALSFRIVYSFWAVNLILADSTFLPKLVQVGVQLASLSLAWWSQEFFHVRMLTASHLFFLDGLFGHYGPGAIDKDFAVIPLKWQPFYNQYVKKTINWVCTVAIVGVLVWRLATYSYII
jgi:hypothetical protein